MHARPYRRYADFYIDLVCASLNYDNGDCGVTHCEENCDVFAGDDPAGGGTNKAYSAALAANATAAEAACDGGLYYCCAYADDADAHGGCDDRATTGCHNPTGCYGESCDFWCDAPRAAFSLPAWWNGDATH